VRDACLLLKCDNLLVISFKAAVNNHSNMNRLVVNPNKPDTWAIQLEDGVNLLGRGEDNDFRIPDASVSGSHCQIIIQNGDVSIIDLGSTNGSFINGTRILADKLHNGQTIRLGNVEMTFQTDVPQPAATPASAAPPPPLATTPASAPAPAVSRLRVSGISHEPEAEATVITSNALPPLLPAIDTHAASSVCKFHPKTSSRWFCPKCKRSFCDLCVNAHGNKRACRACAVECAPLEVEIAEPTETGFMASLPGAFIYPFRGTGVLILIFSAILFSALGAMGGLFSILFKMAAIGYLFSYMQNIIHATANEEAQMPELPGMDDLFSGFLRLAGTVVMSFGLTVGLLVAKFYEVDIPISAIIISLLLGCLYFPMAFLVVAMKDNVMACNPLVVVPSILRVPGQYIVTVVLFAAIFGVQGIGNLVSGTAGSVAFTTTDMSVMFIAFAVKMIWSFTSVYLLTLNMRIMGLLYLTQKEKLGWY
jgi:pSer/pThr/pTyr-binding forkhead associated (FHA) protein